MRTNGGGGTGTVDADLGKGRTRHRRRLQRAKSLTTMMARVEEDPNLPHDQSPLRIRGGYLGGFPCAGLLAYSRNGSPPLASYTFRSPVTTKRRLVALHCGQAGIKMSVRRPQ